MPQLADYQYYQDPYMAFKPSKSIFSNNRTAPLAVTLADVILNNR